MCLALADDELFVGHNSERATPTRLDDQGGRTGSLDAASDFTGTMHVVRGVF